jgi:hypothetical protein
MQDRGHHVVTIMRRPDGTAGAAQGQAVPVPSPPSACRQEETPMSPQWRTAAPLTDAAPGQHLPTPERTP